MALQPEGARLQTFVTDLKRELEVFRQFHQVLTAEQEALVDGHVDGLLALAQSKNEKVVALTELAQRRNQFLTDYAGSTNQIGMEAWLDSADPGDRSGAGRLWRDLIDLARRARELNQHNGQLIQNRLATNQQALGILLGANASTTHLYGADGQAYSNTAVPTGRPLGKA